MLQIKYYFQIDNQEIQMIEWNGNLYQTHQQS